jgi:hypothetical protein
MREETAQEYRQRVARAGGHGRAEKMTAKQRKESARKAAQVRWSKVREEYDRTHPRAKQANAKTRSRVKE